MKAVLVWTPCSEQALQMTLEMRHQPMEGAHTDGGFQMTLQWTPDSSSF